MKTHKILPKLFKKTSTGAQQEWEIWTEGNVICTRWGQTGGAMQTGRDEIKEGKNLGKKNETTPEQQADFEATAFWEKKLKKGYTKDAEAAMEGKTDAIIEGGIFPMLAHKFSEHGHKIVYPAFAQPKLDGHRCIGEVNFGHASMWSRTRKPIKSLPHILRELESINNTLYFDGELYHHDYRENFEELTSFIRQQDEPKEGYEVVQYHIYDFCPSPGDPMLPFEQRTEMLREFFDGLGKESPLKRVETVKVANEDELMEAFEHFTKQGCEGAIVRNALGNYVNKRSYDLQKVKEFLDEEYKVVGIEEGRGKLAGKAIFVCEMADGKQFRAKMIGKLSDLEKYVKNPKFAIGKQMTVKFQGFTKNGLPRFPVAQRLKEDL